jgi:uncharacterized membrane protein YgcG
MEVLSALRHATVNGRPISLSGDTVLLDGVPYPSKSRTAFTNIEKKPLDLATLVAFWQSYGGAKDPVYPEYVAACRSANVGFVIITDIPELRLYLQGKSEAERHLDRSLAAAAPAAGRGGVAVKPGPLPGEESNWSLQRALKEELIYRTRSAILDCGRNLKEPMFELFAKSAGEGGKGAERKRGAEAGEGSTGAGGGGGGSSSGGGGAGAKRARPAEAPAPGAVTAAATAAALERFHGTPIILVPASASSIITIFNAKSLLEEGKYLPSEEARARHHDAARPAMVTINRVDAQGRTCKFYVMDSTDKLKSAGDWLRVVAVFAAGPEWQFKGWKWGQKPLGKDREAEDLAPVKIFSRGSWRRF